MPDRIVEVAGIGPVKLVKHRRAKSLKVTIVGDGTVRVTIPSWVPYRVGLDFARSRSKWILEHRGNQEYLKSGQAIGKSHHLYFVPNDNAEKISTKERDSQLVVTFPSAMTSQDAEVQSAVKKASIRLLRRESEGLLPKRLQQLASQLGFSYTSISVRQLKARWGSCDHKQNITLNIFLMQLPWELIDYVLIHELVHTQHMHHGADFWETFETVLPGAKKRRKSLKAYKPAL